jgi:hypothetical protein
MDTRKKLNEAKYFLDWLPKLQEDEVTFQYHLNAFLNAWRSVLDILLYDFVVEKYALGFTREIEINDKEAFAVALVLKQQEAIKFVKWWRKKQGILYADPLWKKRTVSFHRGNLQIFYQFYGYGTGSSSSTISADSAILGAPLNTTPCTNGTIDVTRTTQQATAVEAKPVLAMPQTNFWSFGDFPDEDLIKKCNEGYKKLADIVSEAEQEFKTKL